MLFLSSPSNSSWSDYIVCIYAHFDVVAIPSYRLDFSLFRHSAFFVKSLTPRSWIFLKRSLDRATSYLFFKTVPYGICEHNSFILIGRLFWYITNRIPILKQNILASGHNLCTKANMVCPNLTLFARFYKVKNVQNSCTYIHTCIHLYRGGCAEVYWLSNTVTFMPSLAHRFWHRLYLKMFLFHRPDLFLAMHTHHAQPLSNTKKALEKELNWNEAKETICGCT